MKQFKKWIGEHPVVALLLIVVLAFSCLSDSFFSARNFVNILIQASALTIVATGMTFVLLTAGIDLSVGAIMFLAGVVSGKLVVAGLSLWLAIPMVFVIGLLFGWINAWSITRLNIIPFLVTLATLYMGRGLGLYLSDTRAVNLPESFLAIGAYRLWGIPLPVLFMVIVVAAFHGLLRYTSFGRQLFAVGNSREKSAKAGIPVRSLLLKVYLISGFCAALGGLIAIAQLGAISPSFGFQYEFMAIAAAVLGGTSLFGGKGSVFPGTLVGALLVQMIQNGLVIINADPYIYPLVTGAIIFLIVLVDSRRHFVRKRALRSKISNA